MCTARSRRTGPRPFHIARSSSGVRTTTGRAAVSDAGGLTRSYLSQVAPASHQSSPTTASGTSAVIATCCPGATPGRSSQLSQDVPQTSPTAGAAAHCQPTRSMPTATAVSVKVAVNDRASNRCTAALPRSSTVSPTTTARLRPPSWVGRRYGAM